MLQHIDMIAPPGAKISRLSRVFCMLHILNLVEKAVLATVNPPRKKAVEDAAETKSDDELDDYDDMPDFEDAFDDGCNDGEGDGADIRALGFDSEDSDESFLEELEAEVFEEFAADAPARAVGRRASRKIFKLAFKIHFSNNLRQALLDACEQKGMPPKILPRPVQTRWNSSVRTLEVALSMRSAIQLLTGSAKNKLAAYAVSDVEWGALQDLHTVLKPFQQATLLMEGMGRPLLHAVIPLMNNLVSKLEDFVDDKKLHASARAGASAGRKVLTKYYSLTDESIMYRLAISELFYMLFTYFDPNYMSSSSPVLQTRLLPQNRLGAGLDRRRQGPGSPDVR